MKSRLRLSAQLPQTTLKVSLPCWTMGRSHSSSSEQYGPTAMSQVSQKVVGNGVGRLRLSASCRSFAQDSPLTRGEGQARVRVASSDRPSQVLKSASRRTTRSAAWGVPTWCRTTTGSRPTAAPATAWSIASSSHFGSDWRLLTSGASRTWSISDPLRPVIGTLRPPSSLAISRSLRFQRFSGIASAASGDDRAHSAGSSVSGPSSRAKTCAISA